MIKNHNLPIKLAKDTLTNQTLHFPGKIALSENGQRIAISNTGYHQILITTNTGLLHYKIGTGTPGWKDGDFSECQFNAPQGLTWDGNVLYVADTENHVIRKVTLLMLFLLLLLLLLLLLEAEIIIITIIIFIVLNWKYGFETGFTL